MQFLQFQLVGFFDGIAIPFGFCKVYLAGTSTLAALFDSGGSPMTNPAHADSSGQVGFAAADGLYDFQPYYADGVTVAGPKILKQQLFDFANISSNSVVVATRTALAALTAPTSGMSRYLAEAGREGWFVFSNANLSAQVSADSAQGIYVAPSGATSGASGAWVRKFVGPASVKWFGATGDGTTNDSAAFVAALACLKSLAVNDIISEFKASPKLFVPAGHYYLGTTTLDITHTLIIEGEGGLGIGAGGGIASKLRWDAGATGIRVQAANTSGATTVDGSTHYSGLSTTIRDLYLAGPGATLAGSLAALGLTEGEFHGVHAKSTINLERVTIEGFQGDGLYAHTTSGGGAPDEGASNGSRAYNCVFKGNRNGRSLKGADANVWSFDSCQYLQNRACGADEQSFLGNSERPAHANGNGVTADTLGTSAFPAYLVSNGGNRYCPVQGMEGTASTTTPTGTADTSVWIYVGAGGTATGIPAFSLGMALRCGAPFRTNNSNGRNEFSNCYEEGNQGPSQFVAPTIVIGGLKGAGDPRGSSVYIRNTNAGHFTIDKLIVPGMFQALNSEIGFFGHSVNFQQSVLGSRGGNAALASLITCLANLGLVVDGSTA